MAGGRRGRGHVEGAGQPGGRGGGAFLGEACPVGEENREELQLSWRSVVSIFG